MGVGGVVKTQLWVRKKTAEVITNAFLVSCACQTDAYLAVWLSFSICFFVSTHVSIHPFRYLCNMHLSRYLDSAHGHSKAETEVCSGPEAELGSSTRRKRSTECKDAQAKNFAGISCSSIT